jgi:Holliday junction resolvase RusA-like endonuclease
MITAVCMKICVSKLKTKLVINSTPKAQGRPRFARIGGFTRVYDPHKKIKDLFKLQFKSQFHGELIEGPIEMDITFYMPAPKSTSKRKLALMLTNEIKHVKKMDTDNMVKVYQDCLNKIVYKDDSQIWSLNAKKLYSDNPRVEIILNY